MLWHEASALLTVALLAACRPCCACCRWPEHVSCVRWPCHVSVGLPCQNSSACATPVQQGACVGSAGPALPPPLQVDYVAWCQRIKLVDTPRIADRIREQSSSAGDSPGDQQLRQEVASMCLTDDEVRIAGGEGVVLSCASCRPGWMHGRLPPCVHGQAALLRKHWQQWHARCGAHMHSTEHSPAADAPTTTTTTTTKRRSVRQARKQHAAHAAHQRCTAHCHLHHHRWSWWRRCCGGCAGWLQPLLRAASS